MMLALKKVLLVAAAAMATFLGCRWLVRSLASDTTKIRWIVESMEEGYDEGDPGQVVAPLAQDWRHEGHGLDRDLLLGGLFQTAIRDRDEETKQLLTRVDIDMDSLAIAVEGETAELDCDATFFRLRKGAWEPVWAMHAEAELAKTDDGWQIVKSRHADLRGTQLGR